MYGSWYPSFVSWDAATQNFKDKINYLLGAFGDKFYVSEWNINASFSAFPATEAEQDQIIADRLDWLQNTSGVLRAYFFTYRWDTQSTYQFALRMNNTWRTWIDSLFNTI